MACSAILICTTVWLPVLFGGLALIANIIRFRKLFRIENSRWRVALSQCLICLYIVTVYIFLATGGFAEGEITARLFFRSAMMMATVGLFAEAIARQ